MLGSAEEKIAELLNERLIHAELITELKKRSHERLVQAEQINESSTPSEQGLAAELKQLQEQDAHEATKGHGGGEAANQLLVENNRLKDQITHIEEDHATARQEWGLKAHQSDTEMNELKKQLARLHTEVEVKSLTESVAAEQPSQLRENCAAIIMSFSVTKS